MRRETNHIGRVQPPTVANALEHGLIQDVKHAKLRRFQGRHLAKSVNQGDDCVNASDGDAHFFTLPATCSG